MDDVGAVVASALVAAARAEGFEPDPSLRLLAWAGPGVEPPAIRDPYDLGELHQRLLSGDERTRRGVWYTPAWLAAELVRHAVDGNGPVADPACGGGAFLLAAAERLGGVEQLWGCDVDPLAVAVAEAALWWWSARRGRPVVAGQRLVVGDALTDTAIPRSAAVVGNPPFLGQLKRATAAGADRRARLRRRFGDVVRPYTDEAWLFLLAAVEATEPGGRVALLQPQSVLGARDAGPIRASIDRRARLVSNLVDDGRSFDAAVQVCAPLLERAVGPLVAGNEWTATFAEARGVPPVELPDGPSLGDVADVHAGFRDEYYGLVDAVRDGGGGLRLVTVGAIDPFVVLDRPQRFGGRRWTDPRVDPSRATGRAARWLDVQGGAKILVATQTRVVEAVADPLGDLVGSVPVLCVRPHDPGALWHILAALHAPAVSAWMLRRSAGTALSADACKPTVALLTRVPLPRQAAAWDRAAAAAQDLAGGTGDVDHFAALADRALGVDDTGLRTWWSQRRPDRRRGRAE